MPEKLSYSQEAATQIEHAMKGSFLARNVQ
jgi:hypothetical protein